MFCSSEGDDDDDDDVGEVEGREKSLRSEERASVDESQSLLGKYRSADQYERGHGSTST